MSEIGEEDVCKMACAQTLDGLTPNPMFSAGACPDFMQRQCYKDGTLFQDDWDRRRDRLRDLNTYRLFSMSMGIPTRDVGFGQSQLLIPPTSSQVFATVQPNMRQQPQRR
ncbi:unnamed protein product [Pylaiella littoralis]